MMQRRLYNIISSVGGSSNSIGTTIDFSGLTFFNNQSYQVYLLGVGAAPYWSDAGGLKGGEWLNTLTINSSSLQINVQNGVLNNNQPLFGWRDSSLVLQCPLPLGNSQELIIYLQSTQLFVNTGQTDIYGNFWVDFGYELSA